MRHTFLAAVAMGLLLLLVPGCISPQELPSENGTGNETPCSTSDQPVCGTDNRTYSNSCTALAAGVQVAYQEPCAPVATCSDTDAGKDFFKTGTARKGSVEKVDYCADNTSVVEHYCAFNDIVNETIECQYGYECRLGKCVSAAPEKPDCTDSDNGLDRYTAGTVTHAGKDYSDYCSIVDTVKEYYCVNSTNTVSDTLLNCPIGFECHDGRCIEMPSVCSETDDGRDVKKKGSTQITKGYSAMEIEVDKCHDNHILREYFCTGNAIANELVNCGADSICVDDTCVSLLCEDSDDGIDSLSAGSVSKGAERYNDTCTAESYVEEYYCSNDDIESAIIKCPAGYVCSYGACTQTPSCSDSDGGRNYNTSGFVQKGKELYADGCMGVLLTEYFCSGDYVTSEIVSCAPGSSCFDGYCKPG